MNRYCQDYMLSEITWFPCPESSNNWEKWRCHACTLNGRTVESPQWKNVSNLVWNVDFLWLYKFEQRWKLDLKQGSCQAALEGAMMEVRSSVQSAFSLQSCQCARAGSNKLEIVNKIVTENIDKRNILKNMTKNSPFSPLKPLSFFPQRLYLSIL